MIDLGGLGQLVARGCLPSKAAVAERAFVEDHREM